MLARLRARSGVFGLSADVRCPLFPSVSPGHNFDDVSFGALLGLAIATLTFQLHANWWWVALHGPNDTPLTDVPNGGVGAGSSSGQNGNARRNSGPSDTPSISDLVSPPTGRRSFARDKDEYPEAPLLDNSV